jgi:Tol biopolymer transport system component
VAVYAAIAGVAVGLLGGWALARSSVIDGASSDAPAPPRNDRARWRGANIGAAVIAPTRTASADGSSLVVVDRAGRLQRTIAANRPWTPRFSPDGRRVAYGAFGAGRATSDLWVTDIDAGSTQRLTDDDADSNDPQWSPDGATIAYSFSAPGGKDVATRRLAGGAARVVASRPGTQFPSDWLRDGTSLIVTDDGSRRHDIIVQPTDGSGARPYAATFADETAARVSPDGRWIAYTSDESGQPEVYLDSYPHPRQRVLVSRGGGVHPVWRGDGRELYYWRNDAVVAVHLDALRSASPVVGTETVLFETPYLASLNTMYDVSPDGERFVIVRQQP